jgi:hypothetical protein
MGRKPFPSTPSALGSAVASLMLFVAGIAVASQGGMQIDREPVARVDRPVGAEAPSHGQRPGTKASNGGSRTDPDPGAGGTGSNPGGTGSNPGGTGSNPGGTDSNPGGTGSDPQGAGNAQGDGASGGEATGPTEEPAADPSSQAADCNAAIARVKGNLPAADDLAQIEWAIDYIAQECGSLTQAKGLLTALERMRAQALEGSGNDGTKNDGTKNDGTKNDGSGHSSSA